MISARYVPAVGVILALALVPTLIHSYAGLVVDDGLSTKAIPETLAGLAGTPSDRRANWGARLFESTDWIERRYSAGTDHVQLTVIRSFDLKSLYHHPELAVAYPAASFVSSRVRPMGSARVPVHVLEGRRPTDPVAVYVLHYGDQFIDDPIRFQLRTSAELLLSGRRQMTLFFARGEREAPDQAIEDLSATKVLFEAIDRFLGKPAG